MIARQLGCDDQTVRNVIHGFNAAGLTVLHEGSSRPHRLRTAFTAEGAERLKDLLHRSPRDFAQERSTWTLELAAQVSFEQGIISHEVSDERRAERSSGSKPTGSAPSTGSPVPIRSTS